MLDAKLVAAAIADRSAYDKVAPHLSTDDFTPQGAFWWKLIQEWYARDRASRGIDPDSLRGFGESRVGNGKQRETVLGFIRDLPNDVSPSNTAVLALELRRRNVGLELAKAIAEGNDKQQAKLVPIFAELRAATELKSKRQVKYEQAAAVEDLFRLVGNERRIPLAPSKLNSRVAGGALPGQHIVLFGRPEMGKSTFSINFSVGMAVRQNQRVLYIGNEDQINILKARAVARVARIKTDELEGELWEQASTVFRDSGGEERLRFMQMFDGGPDDLRQPIEEFEPTVLVLDQIRNLTSPNSDGITQRLDENGQAVRRLLLEYKLIGLSITQAGASAEGKEWLGMDDMDSSKTGLPGTADLIIGLGGSTTTVARGQRALSFPKNKLSSAENAHEGLLVEFDTSRSRVR